VVLTGDQIVASRKVKDALLRDFPQGGCFDMETAAIAQVAFQNGVPWAALRVTSDAADEASTSPKVIGFRHQHRSRSVRPNRQRIPERPVGREG